MLHLAVLYSLKEKESEKNWNRRQFIETKVSKKEPFNETFLTTLKFFSGNFYYVSNLESTFLERIRFASEILFKKSNSVFKIAPKKILVNRLCKNLKVAIFVLSWKPCLEKVIFIWKNRFLIKTSEENQI